MGEVAAYFFDSYAFFEIIEGNKNYLTYSKNVGIITTKLNLLELHYGLLKIYGKEIADRYYDQYVSFAIEIEDDIFKKASSLKAVLSKKKLSYVDCIGYIAALSRGVKFLTGDKQFQELENVEFVK
ncbi:MAG: PIN domain-containing protein [Nanoarchaeota archaeon]